MSNSMPLEKIFIILAIIFGVGSAVDLLYSLSTLTIQLDELLRCSVNIIISIFIYRYFLKRQRLKQSENNL